MDTLHKDFASTRVLSRADNFLVDNDTYYIMCINKAVLNLCCVFLSQPGKWRTTFYTDISETGYTMPTDEQWDTIQDYIDEFLGECAVNCDELVTAINNLSSGLQFAISNTGNCGCSGSGGAGIYEDDASTFVDDGGNFPDGYSDRSDYLASKCRLANLVIQRMRNDLVNLRQINAASYTSATLGVLLTGLLLVPIPFAQIIGLVGLLLDLVAISISAFVDALDELITWLDGLDICLLYSAVSAEEARNNVLSDLDSQTFTNDALTKGVGSYFLSFNSINLLFDAYPEGINIDELPLDSPCDGCDAPACGCSLDESTGVFIGTEESRSYDGTTLIITGQAVASAGAYQVQFGLNEGCSFACCFKVVDWSYTGVNEPFINGYYQCESASFVGGSIDMDTWIANEEVALSLIIQRNDEPFEVTLHLQRP